MSAVFVFAFGLIAAYGYTVGNLPLTLGFACLAGGVVGAELWRMFFTNDATEAAELSARAEAQSRRARR